MSFHRACCCGDEDCCRTPGELSPCEDCIPETIRVTFTGITNCGCERAGPMLVDPFDNSFDYDTTQINGAFTIVGRRIGVWDNIDLAEPYWNNCHTTSTTTAAYWFAPTGTIDCDDDPSNSGSGWTTVYLTRTATHWELEAWHEGISTINVALLLFRGSVAIDATGDCENISDISSDLVVADCGKEISGTSKCRGYAEYQAGFGGSASLEICP